MRRQVGLPADAERYQGTQAAHVQGGIHADDVCVGGWFGCARVCTCVHVCGRVAEGKIHADGVGGQARVYVGVNMCGCIAAVSVASVVASCHSRTHTQREREREKEGERLYRGSARLVEGLVGESRYAHYFPWRDCRRSRAGLQGAPLCLPTD